MARVSGPVTDGWDPTEITVRWEYITPEKAEKYLHLNTDNYRLMRGWKVKLHAEAMRDGQWRKCLVPISFVGYLGDDDTRLSDGQHRLRAIIESGVPSWHLVADGLSEDDEAEMDTGLKRALADHLRKLGYPNSHALGATLRLVHRVQAGTLQEKGPSVSTGVYVRMLKDQPDFEDATRAGNGLAHHVPGPISVFSTFFWLVRQLDDPTGEITENLDEFWERLGSDEGHYGGSPILALRRQLLALGVGGNTARRRKSQTELLALMIKSWNGWLAGDKIQQLTWRAGGRHPEEFPILWDGK